MKSGQNLVEMKNKHAEEQKMAFPIGHVPGFFNALFHHKCLILCKLNKIIAH